MNKLKRLKSPKKVSAGDETSVQDMSSENSSEDDCEDFLYEEDQFDVEDEEMPLYEPSGESESSDTDSDAEEPDV